MNTKVIIMPEKMTQRCKPEDLLLSMIVQDDPQNVTTKMIRDLFFKTYRSYLFFRVSKRKMLVQLIAGPLLVRIAHDKALPLDAALIEVLKVCKRYIDQESPLNIEYSYRNGWALWTILAKRPDIYKLIS